MERFSPFRDMPARANTKARLSPMHKRVLTFLQDYDVLPSTYIKAQFPSYQYTEKAITDLLKWGLLEIPSGYEHVQALYRVRPLAVSCAGETALKLHDLYRPRFKLNDTFKHKYLRNVLQHSRYHARELGFTLKTAEELRDHPSTPEPTRKDAHYRWLPLKGKRHIEPDDFWGIEYQGARMFVHQEDDRGTEMGSRGEHNTKSKTIYSMIRDYRDYLTAQTDWYRYGFATVNILIHTTGEAGRVETILGHINDLCEPKLAALFKVKSVPDFVTEPLLLPKPGPWLLQEDYVHLKNGVPTNFNVLDTLIAKAMEKVNVQNRRTAKAS